MIKLFSIIFLSFLTSVLCAQTSEYEQLKLEYERFRKEQKLDSIKLVAKEMNRWAFIHEGDSSLRYAVSFRYIGNGFQDLDSASLYFEISLETLKKQKRETHPDYANCLKNLGILYYKTGEYKAAEPYYKQTSEIFKKVYGEEHANYANCLMGLGILYSEMGDYKAAETYYTQASEIYKKAYGEEHPDYAGSMHSLGMLYSEMGDYKAAEPYYKQALEIRKKALGEGHPDYATSLNNLGVLYSEMGDYKAAEPYYKQALEIRKKALGDEHPDYATSLNNLACLFIEMGDYKSAEPYYKQALEIRKKVLGEGHPDYAGSLIGFGILYFEMGDYKAAVPYYKQSLAIYKKALGENHPDYAMNLNNLGNLYKEMGDYKSAESYYEQSLEIRRKALGEEHPDYATSLIGLGNLFNEMGDYKVAEPYYKQALEIRRRALGNGHPDYATSLHNLGVLYSELGDYKAAQSYYKQALEIHKGNLGEEHHYYASSLNNIAWLYSIMGDYANAEQYHHQSLEIKRRLLGEGHPSVLSPLKGLLLVATEYGKWEDADSKALSLADWSRIILDKQANLGSSLKEGYKDEFSNVFFLLANYVWFRTSDKLKASNFNQWMFLNGWVNEREALLLKEMELSGDTALKGLYDAYHLYCLQLSNHYELTKDELAKRGIDISKEEEVREGLESDISSRMVSFDRINAVYNFNDLREQLQPDEIYADVLLVPHFDFANHTWSDSSFYMAYIVTSDIHSAPLLINLGDGKQIDEVLYPYLVGQTTDPESATMDGQVYDFLWKPLEEHLAGKTKIYLSPGGIYHSINPETIYHAETGKYLFEEKEIHLVNSGRSFVDQRIYGNREYTDKTALIMGAPNFDYAYVADSTLLEDNVSFTYQTMRDLSLDGNRRAAPLPATRSEVEGINQTLTSTAWNTQLLTGNDAMESNLKQMDSPRILHIATHGYFMEDVKPENDNGMRMMGMDVQRVAENPMLRSGLLLAGCNKTLADNTALTGADNGILTAYEAGLLNLSKTELVVLSACETGKGEILNGEGVQGLRKAMTDAGAEHILMSLWKVDDKVTSEYMQSFYGRYAQGKSIRESYNLTRNEIKQKYPQPYYWGAFVLVGQ